MADCAGAAVAADPAAAAVDPVRGCHEAIRQMLQLCKQQPGHGLLAGSPVSVMPVGSHGGAMKAGRPDGALLAGSPAGAIPAGSPAGALRAGNPGGALLAGSPGGALPAGSPMQAGFGGGGTGLASAQMLQLAAATAQCESDSQRRTAVLELVSHLLTAAFPPSVSLHCFGSSANGLGTSDSDLDIHLDLEGYVSPERTVVSRAKKLDMIAEALRGHADCLEVTAIPHARVPVVKFRERGSGICCDISFKNMMGIYNSQFIRCCTEYDWRLQPLFMTVKYLFKLNNIVGGGGGERLTSYALCLMVIFYLQQLEKPILPPVAETLEYDSEDPERNINGWIFAFSFGELAPLNKENTMHLEHLLTGFFEYYSTFYYEFIICPYFGTELSRASFKAKALVGLDLWLTCAYPKAAEHFKWCFNNTVVYKRGLQTQSPLCIQDPFELNHNVARNVDSATLGKIKKLCSEAVGVCANFQNPKKTRRTNLLHLLDIKIKEDRYDEYADRHLIPNAKKVEEWPQLGSPLPRASPGSLAESSSGECKLTTSSNQLLCYFCGLAGMRYDSFIDLRAHLFEKHNKETRRLSFRPVQVVETVSLRGRQRHSFGFLQNVTCMPEYQDSSQEELRWEHVIVKRNPPRCAKK